jgi:putative SOS response-associated peptidase YedK
MQKLKFLGGTTGAFELTVVAYRTVNARAETVDKAPSFRHYPEFRTIPSKLTMSAPNPLLTGLGAAFVCRLTRHRRQAFAKRRCLIPADGFYEWRKTAKPKLPFAIAMKDGRPFTFAGL